MVASFSNLSSASCANLKSLKLNNRVLAYFVKRDLFLLENQLPYEVLTSLMSLRFDHGEEGKKLMEEFMDRVRGLPGGTQMKNPPGQAKTDMYTDLQYKPTHALDQLRGFGSLPTCGFLDSLIDHSEDVKALRKSGILLNVLGSDQEVADLFNDISRFVGFNSNAYCDVKSSIEKHCKNVTKKWVAEWLHDHFSSPWTFLAFVGALVALVLTFIQTYTALYPGKK
ncbi:PROTEIN putative (DUF247)-RELATED-RELATED [Salix viminalis]|uniref:PROTEIN putative (DUF247)-RELATED-RELATED n=1 Tax=Salix viminalis TaxID=40686 RepID=A0A9Q0ZP42_SALVM|nr:PROTEIN putative (DUF247)-RELATED-RELATED [Salix viminalis]